MDGTEILRDVELRLRALSHARRLRALVDGTFRQLHVAKQGLAEAEAGSTREQQFLHEAAEASTRLSVERDELYAAERELRRTEYLLEILTE